MDTQQLATIAKQMVAEGKGVLAADESNGTCNKRFAVLGIPETEDKRKEWRTFLFSADSIDQYLSGVILFDETIRQKDDAGTSLSEVLSKKGILPGIKVDKGVMDFPGHPGEQFTQGLDGLRERFAEYKEMGATFSKWRSVITIDTEKNLPSTACIQANANSLAIYSLLAQEAGIVPMVEPEVILDGTHTIEEAEEVTTKVLTTLFDTLKKHDVYLPGLILKTSMVVPGNKSGQDMDAKDVALRTSRVLKNCVPQETGGVVFLSGGQSPLDSTKNLNEIAKLGPYPWGVTFSYSRGIQQPVLDTWKGDKANEETARGIYLERLKESSEASLGTYGA